MSLFSSSLYVQMCRLFTYLVDIKCEMYLIPRLLASGWAFLFSSLFLLLLVLVCFLFVFEYLWLLAGHSPWVTLWRGWCALPPRGLHLLCHLPEGSASCIPQMTFSSSGSMSVQVLWHCHQNYMWQFCGHNVPGSISLSLLLPLALFSSQASFCVVLGGYEDKALVYPPCGQRASEVFPAELQVSSGLPAFITLHPGFCSPPLGPLGPWNEPEL